ncbi:MAG: hypothetical protein RI945_234, partial [Candidatus Parcubacteria bacterium]
MNTINKVGNSSKKVLYIIIGVLVLIILAFFLKGGFSRSVNVGGYKAEVTKNFDGSTTVKSENGLANGTYSTGKLLDSWPSDAPVYPNAEITQSTFVDSQVVGTEASFLASLTTSDSEQTVMDYYKKELSINGWAINSAMSTGSRLFATKSNRMLTIVITNLKNGGVMISESTGIISESLQKSLDSISSLR